MREKNDTKRREDRSGRGDRKMKEMREGGRETEEGKARSAMLLTGTVECGFWSLLLTCFFTLFPETPHLLSPFILFSLSCLLSHSRLPFFPCFPSHTSLPSIPLLRFVFLFFPISPLLFPLPILSSFPPLFYLPSLVNLPILSPLPLRSSTFTTSSPNNPLSLLEREGWRLEMCSFSY